MMRLTFSRVVRSAKYAKPNAAHFTGVSRSHAVPLRTAGSAGSHAGARFPGPELLDAVLLELVVERRGLDAEQARGLGLDLAGLRVGFQDQLPLEVIEDLGQRHLARHVEPVLLSAT